MTTIPAVSLISLFMPNLERLQLSAGDQAPELHNNPLTGKSESEPVTAKGLQAVPNKRFPKAVVELL